MGDLRFRAPLPPTGRNATVNDGSIGRVCPQANPAWLLTVPTFVEDYLTGQPFNASTNSSSSSASAGNTLPPQDPRTTEDCLFLDILSPKAVLSKASRGSGQKGGVPVLVWIYGGGYTVGEKSEYNAAGLIAASRVSAPDGIVFVSLNYRLGAFGWLSGPTFQSDGVANAGLYDQRLALQWIQQNIHLFGGDPRRVTVIGESAGGGSILHQITAFGGLQGPAPFQQAVLQSPGFQSLASNQQQELIYEAYLKLLNVSSVAEARKLSYSTLQKANILQVGGSSYGLFTYGPVVDGLIAPAIPGKLLLQGSFDKSLKLMLGHNADEGLVFTSPFIQNDMQYDDYLKSVFPTITPPVADYIENVLYPPTMPGILGTTGYKDETGRLVLTIGENVFT